MKERPVFLEHMRSFIAAVEQRGKLPAVHVYASAMNAFSVFLEEKGLKPCFLTAPLLTAFQSHLHTRGRLENTVSTYMRSLRAACRWEGNGHKTSYNSRLFKDVFVGVESKKKRAQSEKSMGKVLFADKDRIPPELLQAHAYLSLQFLLCGIPYIDLYYLRKSDLDGNTLTYHRHKTNVDVTLTVPDAAISLIRLYADPDSDYLLKMDREVKRDPDDEETPEEKLMYDAYQHALRRYNEALARLGTVLHTEKRLSSYSPRHSWASIAYHHGVPIGIISRALGHTSLKTTEFYLRPFNGEEIGKANGKVIRLVKDCHEKAIRG